MAAVLVYTHVEVTNTQMLLLGFPLGFFASGIFSGMGAFFTELFPTRIRGSGQGFSYNFGRGVGALFPSLVGYLSATMPLGRAIGVFAASAYAVLFVAAVLLPETRGGELVWVPPPAGRGVPSPPGRPPHLPRGSAPAPQAAFSAPGPAALPLPWSCT